MSSLARETVLNVHHWTDSLFSFQTTRQPSFRFKNGQFTMIGMEVDGRPLMRAYSMASANYEDALEFFSIKVPDGPLTSRLRHLREGDSILVGAKATGTLVVDHLLPGRRLYLLATGTGLAPFLSIIKDPEIYDRFDRVILTHTCRRVNELAYRALIEEALPANDFFGEEVKAKLIYHPTVTREPFANPGRITDLIRAGTLFADLDLPPLDPAQDRVMVCGGPPMLAETVDLLEGRGFSEGSGGEPGHYVVERAFVDR